MLVIDEADSLLSDRRGAVRSWEVTQVNEMLTWMEKPPAAVRVHY
jgi:transitional endoplasmic reticulum ATPase